MGSTSSGVWRSSERAASSRPPELLGRHLSEPARILEEMARSQSLLRAQPADTPVMPERDLQHLPNTADRVRALDSRDLFRADVDQFMDLIWQERERRLRLWAEEGRTQAWIAQEVGRDQRTVGRWQKRFEIEPSRPHKEHAARGLGAVPNPEPEPEPEPPTDEELDLDPSQWEDDAPEPELEPEPDTVAAVKAADKAGKLLSKGLDVDPVEGAAFIEKARQLVTEHGLQVLVIPTHAPTADEVAEDLFGPPPEPEFGAELIAEVQGDDDYPPERVDILRHLARKVTTSKSRKPFEPVEDVISKLSVGSYHMAESWRAWPTLIAKAPPELRALWRCELGLAAQGLIEFSELFEEPAA